MRGLANDDTTCSNSYDALQRRAAVANIPHLIAPAKKNRGATAHITCFASTTLANVSSSTVLAHLRAGTFVRNEELYVLDGMTEGTASTVANGDVAVNFDDGGIYDLVHGVGAPLVAYFLAVGPIGHGAQRKVEAGTLHGRVSGSRRDAKEREGCLAEHGVRGDVRAMEGVPTKRPKEERSGLASSSLIELVESIHTKDKNTIVHAHTCTKV